MPHRNPFKFSAAKPSTSAAALALVEQYVAAGWDRSDAERMAAKDVKEGRFRKATSGKVEHNK